MPLSRMIRLGLGLALAALVTLAPAAAHQAIVEKGSIRLGGTPLQLISALDSLWVITCDRDCSGEARASAGRIVRIDPRRGRVIASVPLSRPGALAVGPSGVYATDFWRGTLRRLDPETLRTRANLRLVLPFEVAPGDNAFLPFDVAIGKDAVWVSTARGALARVDLHASRVLRMVRLPGKTTGAIAVDERGVWIAEDLLGVYRVDLKTNRVVARIRIGQPTQRLAVDLPLGRAGSVLAVGSWARNDVLTGARGFARIDLRRNQAQTVMPLPSGPLAVALGEGSLWAARVGGSQVEQVDARTGKIVGRFRAAGDVVALAVGQGRIWTAARDGTVSEVSRG